MKAEIVAPVFGKMRLNKWSELLNTDMREFNLGSIHGLARIVDRHVIILAVCSDDPGKGAFRLLISNLKNEYDCISVIQIFNPDLEIVLRRYGFSMFAKTLDGELVTGMRWTKHLTNK